MATTEKPEVTFGKITDEALAAMRAKFGIPYYMIRQNEAAAKDSITQFRAEEPQSALQSPK